MKLKKYYILITIILLVSVSVSSQVRVGNFRTSMLKFKKLKKKTISRFKEKTTKFILPDFYAKEEYERILNEVWDVTPFEVILLNDFDENMVDYGDALAQFVSRCYSKGGGITDGNGFRKFESFHVYFCTINFMLVDEINKKSRTSTLNLRGSNVGSIYFSRDLDAPVSHNHDKDNGLFLPVENKEPINNFRLGYLKNYLQLTNRLIKNEKSFDIYEDFVDPQLKELKEKTLYIDDEFEIPPRVMENYSFKYKFVSYNEIEEMINDKKSPEFYYFRYHFVNEQKILIITNGKNGDIVYQKDKWAIFGYTERDFKVISSKIKNLNK